MWYLQLGNCLVRNSPGVRHRQSASHPRRPPRPPPLATLLLTGCTSMTARRRRPWSERETAVSELKSGGKIYVNSAWTVAVLRWSRDCNCSPSFWLCTPSLAWCNVKIVTMNNWRALFQNSLSPCNIIARKRSFYIPALHWGYICTSD